MTMHTKIAPQTLSPRIEAVRRRHRQLDDRVAREQGRPMPDTSVLQRLKREKLRLKDELAHYEGLMRPPARGRAAI